ncbi:MAG: IS4 family transposase [Melioribacteraceae bacterium]|nr:IS4 family transposase [Melioribacteraceae bacterium]
MKTIAQNKDWQLLLHFLPAGWERQAKELGALKRQRKFKSASDLLRILLIHLADSCSMREAIARAKQGGIISISDVALLKRLRVSSEWFRWMSIELLKKRGIFNEQPKWLEDYNVRTVDASVITEPGSTGTDWRLHYSIKLFNLQCDHFFISRPNIGESFVNYKINERDLLIGDRAYGRLKGITYVEKNGGSFLTRMKNKAFDLYDKDNNKVQMLQEFKKMIIGEVKEIEVYATTKANSKLNMRLIAIRKSDEEAKKTRQKVISKHKRNQTSINQETLELHSYIILITSLPNTITKYQIAELYRIRWQIEIAFKRLKSIMGLGHLPKTDEDSCRAWLHGKMFVALLAQSIVDEANFFSPWGYPIRQYES